jgi:alkylation response protein AidB-like acyl-CoA dehydrogenase
MDFRLTDEQEMLAETVSRLFADSCTGADLRRLLAEGAARDAGRWGSIVEMGLPGLMAPEDIGGAGLGPIEMALVSIAAGYWALPEPLVEHAGVAVPMLVEAGVTVLEGTVAVGHPGSRLVADADTATALLLADGTAVHLVPTEKVRLTRRESIDPFRRLFAVAWQPTPSTLIAEEGWERTFDHGALFAAAQLLGLAQRAIDVSVAYAKERQQFGKPIGSFQAVKHHLATAQVKVEFARPVVLAAAALLAEGAAQASMRISHAKLAATRAAEIATHAAVQVHGAMGYSWEVDVHFVLKRALALGQAWGTPGAHKARIAAHVLHAPLGTDCTFGDASSREMALERA